MNNNSTTSGVFLFQLVNTSTATGGACLANLTISAGGPTNTSIHGSNSAAVLANGIGNSKTGMWIHDIIVKNHDIGVDLEGVLYVYLTNFTLLYQHSYGIKLNGSAFINNGVISNSGATGFPAAAGTAGFLWVDGGGLYMHDVDITAMPNGVMVQPIAGGSVSAGLFDSVLGDTSNTHGWLFDATHGPIFQMQLTGCWGGFNGCYSPAILAQNITDADTTITVHPSTSQPYPSGLTHLTLNQEQIVCASYAPPTFSECSRGAFRHGSGSAWDEFQRFCLRFPGRRTPCSRSFRKYRWNYHQWRNVERKRGKRDAVQIRHKSSGQQRADQSKLKLSDTGSERGRHRTGRQQLVHPGSHDRQLRDH